jgi:formiminoglutamase
LHIEVLNNEGLKAAGGRLQKMLRKNMNSNDIKKKVFLHLLSNIHDTNNSSSEAKTLMLGFACDEGVRRNNGRPGAIGGPEAFKRCWKYLPGDEKHIADGGILYIQNQALSLFQAEFGGYVSKGINRFRRVLAIGGGHEITWAMHLGMTGADCNESMPVIGHLNFDAHFDLRPYFKGPNSGTSFCQIADERSFSGLNFHYLCLGLDTRSTPDFLFHTAKRHG